MQIIRAFGRSFSVCGDNTTRGFVYTEDTSVIQGHIYLQINVHDLHLYNPCLLGYIREDTATGKVYFLDPDSMRDFVLYDFGMNIGDSMPITFTNNGQTGYFQTGSYTLDSIDNVDITAGARKEFFLNCHTCSNSHTLRWIEGCGQFNR